MLHLRLGTQTHTFRPICVFGQLANYVKFPQLASYCISIATGTLNTDKSEFHIWSPAGIGMHLVYIPLFSVWILTMSGWTHYCVIHGTCFSSWSCFLLAGSITWFECAVATHVERGEGYIRFFLNIYVSDIQHIIWYPYDYGHSLGLHDQELPDIYPTTTIWFNKTSVMGEFFHNQCGSIC